MPPAAPKPVFQLIAGHPVLDLVNTLDWRFRRHGEAPAAPVEALNSYADLLSFVEQSGLWTPQLTRQLHAFEDQPAAERILVRVRQLRESCAEVIYAAIDGREQPAAAHNALSKLFKAALATQHLVWTEARLQWQWPQQELVPELPLWLLGLSAANLLISPDLARVRACENPECRWLLYDTSKNRTRRWCQMSLCGNRMKVRRFKAKSAPSPGRSKPTSRQTR